jgi:periplasmic protein TonB
MREPALRLDANSSDQPALWKRIHENLRSVWTLPSAALTAAQAANGAPIHLFDERREKTGFRAQAGSTCLHVVIFVVAIYAAIHPIDKAGAKSLRTSFPLPTLRYTRPTQTINAETPSLGKAGSGGDHNPLPPTAGELAHLSRMALASPRLPDDKLHALPVSATVFDASAPELAPPAKDLGLPWMADRNNSEGIGKAGIGRGPGVTMGDSRDGGSGLGNSLLPYARIATQVICKVCPDPAYSDEARKAKLQGLVTMRVLVGGDGRVRDVQITRGIGLGLDENAVHAVRGWQFLPAKDAEGHPAATWITIETVFRLF